jgi:NAD(P)-dependent dehydrogenase (short-subunit alcohol dehydrogenase family)
MAIRKSPKRELPIKESSYFKHLGSLLEGVHGRSPMAPTSHVSNSPSMSQQVGEINTPYSNRPAFLSSPSHLTCSCIIFAETIMPRVFFVTGSSAGLGQALVKEVLDNGDYVIATARKPEVLVFEKATSTNFIAVQLDLLDSKGVLTAYLTGVAKFGRIDVVVNNGGYGLSGPFEDLTDEDIKRQMDVNFTGALVSTRTAIKVMREQNPPGGIIQQITSIGGRIGMPWMCMYSASKFALEGFTEAVAQEMHPKWGIRFTCVEPGGFR